MCLGGVTQPQSHRQNRQGSSHSRLPTFVAPAMMHRCRPPRFLGNSCRGTSAQSLQRRDGTSQPFLHAGPAPCPRPTLIPRLFLHLRSFPPRRRGARRFHQLLSRRGQQPRFRRQPFNRRPGVPLKQILRFQLCLSQRSTRSSPSPCNSMTACPLVSGVASNCQRAQTRSSAMTNSNNSGALVLPWWRRPM